VPIAIGGVSGSAGLFLLTRIVPSSGYAEIWWPLALVGLGFGLMLSPLSAAALAAVDQHRAGLASSVANTTRQVGTVVGIALLGALVQARAVSHAASALRALPHATAEAIASALGHGGAEATLPTVLPPGFSAARLHAISAEAYVTGVRTAFAIDALVLLAAAVIAAVLLRGARPSRTAAKPAVGSMEAGPVAGAQLAGVGSARTTG
jgi:hypothetical protein